MPRLQRVKRLRVPSTSVVEEELEDITASGPETSQTGETLPRKKVRWDGNVETQEDEEDEEEESSSSGTAEKVFAFSVY